MSLIVCFGDLAKTSSLALECGIGVYLLFSFLV